MSNLQNFQIVFDNPNSTYYAGQQISGRVIVHTTKEKRMRGICLKLNGEADVYWTESSRSVTDCDGESGTEYDSYSAHETYIQMETWVVGASHGDMLLPPGEHVYPFTYSLPLNIPSSFEGSCGHVRYTVKATVDRPWKFDHECKVAFTVLTSLDLNLEQNMLEPTQTTKEKYLCCCCCRSGPITVVINVLRGFVPGQRIEAVIECDNVTNEEMTVRCYLEKRVTFQSKQIAKKVDEDMVAVERLGTVRANGSQTWTSNITVPPLPPSYLIHCNCIDISYRFVVKGSIHSVWNKDLHVYAPIVIGTIPITSYFPRIIPSAPISSDISTSGTDFPPSFNDAIGMASAPSFQPGTPYPDMPPPTYEECMLPKGNIRNKEDSDHAFGPMEFAPRYPMYNFR